LFEETYNTTVFTSKINPKKGAKYPITNIEVVQRQSCYMAQSFLGVEHSDKGFPASLPLMGSVLATSSVQDIAALFCISKQL
jgi:hypothetical protein